MKHTEYLEYAFTDAEIAEFGRELARAARSKASLEQQKKEVDSQLKADIEVQNSVISKMSQCVMNGREWRTVDCLVILDTPEPGKKTIRRTDTGADVKVLPMTEADRQMVLDLTAKADAADEAKGPFPMPGAPQSQLPEPAVESQVNGATLTLVPDSAPLAPAAVMGGTHQRKARAPRDAKREAAADGTETE